MRIKQFPVFIDTNAAAGIYAVAFVVLHSISVVIRVMVHSLIKGSR